MRIASSIFAVATFLASVIAASQAMSAGTRGVTVQLRDSNNANAPVAEEVKLYGSSHALVIGIDRYTKGWPRLSNAVKDAQVVAQELREKGFDVNLKTDLSSDALRRELRSFFAIKGSDPDARLLLWYAGHGHTVDGEGFLVPADAPPATDPTFLVTSLHMRDFGGLMRLAKSKHVLSVFDSCFSGTIFQARSGAAPAAITRKTTKPVRQFLTSGDAGQQVRDDGSFRELFVRAIRGDERADVNGDGYVTGEELGLFLSQRVAALTGAAQTPKHGKLHDVKFDQGDFVFVLPGGAEPSVTTGTSSLRGENAMELAFWNTIQNSTNPASFKAYLSQYPNGTFTALARVKIEELKTTRVASLPPAVTFEVIPLDEEMVATKNANVRAEPTTSAEKIGRLNAGTKVGVTGRTKVSSATWYRVAMAGNRTGYVFGTLLSEIAVVVPKPKPDPNPVNPGAVVSPKKSEPVFPGTGPDVYAVQLLSVRSSNAAKMEWERLQLKNGDLLGRLTLAVVRRDLGSGKGVFFSGRAGPFSNADDARLLCDSLKNRNIGCLVVLPRSSAQEYQVVAVVPPQPSPAPSGVQPAVGVYPMRPGQTFKDCPECPEMVVIPAGSFRMGDVNGGEHGWEKPVHKVAIPRPFAVGKYEVTQAEWQAMMGNNRSEFKGSRNPVETVNWDDAKEFVRKLSAKTGKPYRLLSEAEWEYAARAGSPTKYPWGDTASHEYANYGTDYCCKGSAQGRDRWEYTSPVGQFAANGYLLHDLHGNVYEWTEDCWHENYNGAPTDGSAWTSGNECGRRVLRGGSWNGKPGYAQSASRNRNDTDIRSSSVGFRVARAISQSSATKSEQVAVVMPPKPSPIPSPVQPAVGVYPRQHKPGDTFKDCRECPEMVVIPAGSFRMGNLNGGGDSNENPVHNVTIPRSFAVGKYEVTQAEWQAMMGSNPSQYKGLRNPVERVSWNEAKGFVRKLSAKTGKTYRLLSEAEWEYVARAGTSTDYWWGSRIGHNRANCESCGSRWDNKQTAPAGSFSANPFGLYDTVGNVWEWTEDCWHEGYNGAPTNGNAWTTGGNCDRRVHRGGSLENTPRVVRSMDRNWFSTVSRTYSVGFRVARNLD
jgi:formylglycine-generating enzyme required for sulfatase activity/uncharacterized protein YgiM (DUF1202 family)